MSTFSHTKALQLRKAEEAIERLRAEIGKLESLEKLIPSLDEPSQHPRFKDLVKLGVADLEKANKVTEEVGEWRSAADHREDIKKAKSRAEHCGTALVYDSRKSIIEKALAEAKDHVEHSISFLDGVVNKLSTAPKTPALEPPKVDLLKAEQSKIEPPKAEPPRTESSTSTSPVVEKDKVPKWVQKITTAMTIVAALVAGVAGVLGAFGKLKDAIPSYVSDFFHNPPSNCLNAPTFKERVECEQQKH